MSSRLDSRRGTVPEDDTQGSRPSRAPVQASPEPREETPPPRHHPNGGGVFFLDSRQEGRQLLRWHLEHLPPWSTGPASLPYRLPWPLRLLPLLSRVLCLPVVFGSSPSQLLGLAALPFAGRPSCSGLCPPALPPPPATAKTERAARSPFQRAPGHPLVAVDGNNLMASENCISGGRLSGVSESWCSHSFVHRPTRGAFMGA